VPTSCTGSPARRRAGHRSPLRWETCWAGTTESAQFSGPSYLTQNFTWVFAPDSQEAFLVSLMIPSPSSSSIVRVTGVGLTVPAGQLPGLTSTASNLTVTVLVSVEPFPPSSTFFSATRLP